MNTIVQSYYSPRVAPICNQPNSKSMINALPAPLKIRDSGNMSPIVPVVVK